MKDRFKFRARRPCGDWVVGGLHRNGLDEWCITTADGQMCYLIEIDTAGQCTGLKERNGVLIYEGDAMSDGDVCCIVKFGHYDTRNTHGLYGWFIEDVKHKQRYHLTQDIAYNAEVIGNIHENPELLV